MKIIRLNFWSVTSRLLHKIAHDTLSKIESQLAVAIRAVSFFLSIYQCSLFQRIFVEFEWIFLDPILKLATKFFRLPMPCRWYLELFPTTNICVEAFLIWWIILFVSRCLGAWLWFTRIDRLRIDLKKIDVREWGLGSLWLATRNSLVPWSLCATVLGFTFVFKLLPLKKFKLLILTITELYWKFLGIICSLRIRLGNYFTNL